jgi:hypothetical protein
MRDHNAWKCNDLLWITVLMTRNGARSFVPSEVESSLQRVEPFYSKKFGCEAKRCRDVHSESCFVVDDSPVLSADMEGGASCGALPHAGFGLGPISSVS